VETGAVICPSLLAFFVTKRFNINVLKYFMKYCSNVPKDWHTPCFRESKSKRNHLLKEVIMAATYVETGNRIPATITRVQGKWREKLSERFWFSVCLIMFMILGPFAAPIALGFVFSNYAQNREISEPDQVPER
jgi:hypothetical protein